LIRVSHTRKVLAAALLAVPLFLFLLLALLMSWRPSLSSWPQWPETDLEVPNTLSVTWLGTSTLLVSDGETHLLTDGYFTRVSKLTTLTRPLAPDQDRIAAMLARYQIHKLDAVLVVHSHFDHVMDSPWVAMQTGAALVGSDSTANVGRGAGMDESSIRVAVPGEAIRFGEFEVTFLLSDHVPQAPWIDRLTGIGEQITEPLSPPARVDAWKEGESWALILVHPAGRMLIQGSAGFVEGQLEGYQVDLALVSSVGLSRQQSGYAADYVRNTIAVTGARQVVPIHWDDFFLPWRAQQTPALPRVMEDLDASFALLKAEAEIAGASFVVVRPGQTIHFRSSPP
jgi:L-ascorbate metabolism protein UlaG (beta-lactamase superfamily)